jgi:hypothetical protein
MINKTLHKNALKIEQDEPWWPLLVNIVLLLFEILW